MSGIFDNRERVLALSKMSRSQLLVEERRVRPGRRIYGNPSKEEIIAEILRAEQVQR